VAAAVISVVQAFILAKIIVDIFQGHQSINLFDIKIVGLFILLALRAILNLFSEWMSSLASTKIRNELRSKVLRRSLEAGSETANEVGSARLSLLLSSGIGSLDGYFAKFVPQLFTATIVPISVALVIALKDWQTGLIVLLTIPLIPIFGILIGRFTAAATAKKWQALGVLSGYFLDLLSGLTTLKVYGRTKLQKARIQKVGDDYRKETMKVLRISFLSSLALELIATLSVALIAVSIGLRLVGGSLSLETALIVLILAPEVYWPIRQVAGYFHAAADGMEVFGELYGILDRPESNGSISIESFSAVSWSDLVVHYGSRAAIQIPAGIAKAGEVHLIVGPSGSGKSTLAKLLLGFKTPSSGEILFNSQQGLQPISQLEKSSLRSLISWMPQEPKFPVGTIRSILLDAKADASDVELEQTLRSVALEISDLANGLATKLGALHQPLSVGQLRKIALARALLKDAEMLIVDEPSASVDDVSEEIIHKVLSEFASKGKVVIVITHRSFAIAKTDSMTVMKT